MTWFSFILLAVSVVGAVVVIVRQAYRERSLLRILFDTFVLLLFAVPALTVLPLPFSSNLPQPRGGESSGNWFMVVLYVFVLLGMLAHYAYSRFSRPTSRRPAFDFGLFIAPVFTSPIVFIPLLGTVQSAGIDLYSAHGARMMLFLVAFENGFFWKLIFDQRRQILENRSRK